MGLLDWDVYAFCPECDFLIERPSFGDVWFTASHYPVCPGCGCKLYGHSIVKKIARYVHAGKWYLPWTWLNFKLEYKDEDKGEKNGC